MWYIRGYRFVTNLILHFFFLLFEIIFLTCSHLNSPAQVSEYLKKQMTAVEGQDSDELKNMLQENDKLVEEIFQHEDKDKNGFISHDEFSGPKHDEL